MLTNIKIGDRIIAGQINVTGIVTKILTHTYIPLVYIKWSNIEHGQSYSLNYVINNFNPLLDPNDVLKELL